MSFASGYASSSASTMMAAPLYNLLLHFDLGGVPAMASAGNEAGEGSRCMWACGRLCGHSHEPTSIYPVVNELRLPCLVAFVGVILGLFTGKAWAVIKLGFPRKRMNVLVPIRLAACVRARAHTRMHAHTHARTPRISISTNLCAKGLLLPLRGASLNCMPGHQTKAPAVTLDFDALSTMVEDRMATATANGDDAD